MTRVDVRPDAFREAAVLLDGDVVTTMSAALTRLQASLAAHAGMAGADPAGLDWAAAYDCAASRLLSAGCDLVNGTYHASVLLEATAANHERADLASAPGGRVSGPWAHDGSWRFAVGGPASAVGGSGDSPAGWWLIEHTVGYVWPDGHQDRLHAVADAWSACADAFVHAGDTVPQASVGIIEQRSPEVDGALRVTNGLSDGCHHHAAACRSLAAACRQYAHHLDVVHSAVIHELVELAAWSAAIEGIGVLASIVTLGAAEGPTQEEQASRIAATSAKIARLIQEFTTAARAVAESIPTVTGLAEGITVAMERILGLRVAVAGADAAKALPAASRVAKSEKLVYETRAREGAARVGAGRISPARLQIEAKFKHARDFGVQQSRGAAGYDAFEARINEFVNAPENTTIKGVFHRQPAILTYNETSGLVVIRRLDKSFWSCWKMNPDQLRNVVERGSVGGG